MMTKIGTAAVKVKMIPTKKLYITEAKYENLNN